MVQNGVHRDCRTSNEMLMVELLIKFEGQEHYLRSYPGHEWYRSFAYGKCERRSCLNKSE